MKIPEYVREEVKEIVELTIKVIDQNNKLTNINSGLQNLFKNKTEEENQEMVITRMVIRRKDELLKEYETNKAKLEAMEVRNHASVSRSL